MSSGSGAAKKRAVAKPRIEAEDERRRVARELHDDIGQRLALLADDADRLRSEFKIMDAAGLNRLDTLAQQARDLGEDLRRISHSLHPIILEDLGTVPAIRSLVEEFTQRTGMPADVFDLHVPPHLPLELGTTLYRILQEALRNIAKHAGPTPVHVSLTGAPGEIVLEVSDAGVGFEPRRHCGLGLISMRERAALAGGSLRITSAPGKGTCVKVHLPFTDWHAS